MASSVAHPDINRLQKKEIQAAMAKAVELRAIHAALLQGGGSSPEAMSLLAGASPISRFSHQFSSVSEDYPVFNPTYEDKRLPGYRFISPDPSLSENWNGIRLEGEAIVLSDMNSLNNFSSLKDDQNPIMQTAHGAQALKSSSSRRSTTADCKTATFNTKANPATISREEAPSVDTLTPSLPTPSKSKGPIFSWLFHKTKKKTKPELSQLLKDWGIFSLEALKMELFEANEGRDAALVEVAEMRSSLGELRQKLATLESYCDELKKTKPVSSNHRSNENSMPVSHEDMVEGFLQVVSEARLSVKHFCKALINNIDKTDSSFIEKLSILVHQNLSSSDKKHTKNVLYHLESLINKSLYQDFENSMFKNNGTPKLLDPHGDQMEKFSSFVAIRNLSWNEVLKKGTKYYSDDFSCFCDQKMSSIVSILNLSRPWPELLLQSFFVSAKCIWLLHLLAFSFDPPLVILRVDENRRFDPLYMEDVFRDRQHREQVKIMVMPGFYVHDKVLRCRVLCS